MYLPTKMKITTIIITTDILTTIITITIGEFKGASEIPGFSVFSTSIEFPLLHLILLNTRYLSDSFLIL